MVAVLVCLLVVLVAGPARSYYLSGQRWASNQVIPIYLQLGSATITLLDGFTSWNQSAEDGLARWNVFLGSGVQFGIATSTPPTPVMGDGKNSCFFSSTDFGMAWGSEILAVTHRRWNSSTNLHTEADVVFNSTKSWNSYRGPLRPASGGGTLHDFHRVAIHEFGHALGLGHPDENGQFVVAVMNSHESDTDAIQNDDSSGVQALYGQGGGGVSLTAALDGNLTWTTGSDRSWVGQTAVTYDGVDAAVSGGPLQDNQQSWIECAVNGPGTLTFWWKVSSEAGYDFLRFRLDGSEVGGAPGISGTVDWQQRAIPIPAGLHFLRWTYAKDYSVSVGSDAGWLDQVYFTGGIISSRRGDFNADGQSDIIWQNNATGQRAIWLMNGSAQAGERFLPTVATSWQIAGTGDFNRDGQVDIIWQNLATGQRAVWLMNGSAQIGERFLPTIATAWSIATVGDFNADGNVDIVWQNTATGQRAIWLMNETAQVGERFLPTIATQWSIVSASDFNGDGQTDLLWQNTSTGQRAIWLMNGTSQSGERFLPTIAVQWSIAGTGDYNNDGQADLVWQNTATGQRAIWLMNGTAQAGERFLPTIALEWEIRNR